MDYLLRFILRAGPLTFVRQYYLLWDGDRGNGRDGLGVVDRHGFHTVRCDGNGGDLLGDAYEWGALLCQCCIGATWVGPFCVLDDGVE